MANKTLPLEEKTYYPLTAIQCRIAANVHAQEMSDKGRRIVIDCFSKIEYELEQHIDRQRTDCIQYRIAAQLL